MRAQMFFLMCSAVLGSNCKRPDSEEVTPISDVEVIDSSPEERVQTKVFRLELDGDESAKDKPKSESQF